MGWDSHVKARGLAKRYPANSNRSPTTFFAREGPRQSGAVHTLAALQVRALVPQQAAAGKSARLAGLSYEVAATLAKKQHPYRSPAPRGSNQPINDLGTSLRACGGDANRGLGPPAGTRLRGKAGAPSKNKLAFVRFDRHQASPPAAGHRRRPPKERARLDRQAPANAGSAGSRRKNGQPPKNE